MRDFRYIDGAATLTMDTDKCIGCGLCATVCPHQVFALREKKAVILDLDGCMECGACRTNCPTGAVDVHPGVGCASLILANWLDKLTKGKIKFGCC